MTMMTDCNILLFKTNIRTELDKQSIQTVLDALDGIERWNIDQQDVDCVLRILSDKLTHDQVILMVNAHGFECAELE